MRIVLGLGNPGARYEGTRHNLGFRVLDRLRERWGGKFEHHPEPGAVARWTRTRIGGHDVILAKPWNYMNRSGRATLALTDVFAADPGELLVVYDDADLPLGQIRLRPEGGHGGHNGMRSIIAALRTRAIPRIRLGVLGDARESMDLADYVLSDFETEERAIADALVDLGAGAVESVLDHGFDEAMNLFNGRSALSGDHGAPPRDDGGS